MCNFVCKFFICVIHNGLKIGVYHIISSVPIGRKDVLVY